MEIQLKIDTEKKTDCVLFATLGLMMHSYRKVLDDIEKESAEEEEREENESNEQTAQPEAKQEETADETPVAETPAEPTPEKPKRTRKKKAEPVAEETPVEETPAEAPEAEEPKTEEPKAEAEQGELPFDKEVEQPAEEAKAPTMTEDEWRGVLMAKREELKLDGENADKKKNFNKFVMELALDYGAEKPKLLTPENLYKFVNEKFKAISIDGEGKFYVMPF